MAQDPRADRSRLDAEENPITKKGPLKYEEVSTTYWLKKLTALHIRTSVNTLNIFMKSLHIAE